MAAKLLALIMKYLNKSISSSSKDAKKVKSTSKKQDVTVGPVISQSTKNHKGISRHFGMGLLFKKSLNFYLCERENYASGKMYGILI